MFVNPDLMAQGMSPTDIRLSAIGAGRQTLERIDELIAAKTDFGFETTLSGRSYLKLLAKAKAQGYRIFLYYLWMPSAVMLPSRIRHRVLAGGHDVPTADVIRRFSRSIANLADYVALADAVRVFDATGTCQRPIYARNGKETVFDRERTERMHKELSI